MRVISTAKIVVVAAVIGAMAGFSGGASAAKMAPAAGACAFGKKAVANTTFCSFDCNPANGWCSQKMCVNGSWQPMINCYGAFCSVRCGA
jgi:hypothetical protein